MNNHKMISNRVNKSDRMNTNYDYDYSEDEESYDTISPPPPTPLPSSLPPKKGRPFKYATDDERKAARQASLEKYRAKPFVEGLSELAGAVKSLEHQIMVVNRRIDKLVERIGSHDSYFKEEEARIDDIALHTNKIIDALAERSIVIDTSNVIETPNQNPKRSGYRSNK